MAYSYPQYFVIDDWERLYEMNTSGTRSKFVVLSPSNDSYYFKTSLKKIVDGKVVKEFPSEFWSEIVASQLGNMLNLPVLRYDIASYKDTLGCISKNMAKDDEEITEGVRIITNVMPSFPIDPDYKQKHFLDLVQKSLARIGISKFKRIAIEMLLFDCIIGNSDRHSENWALIKKNKTLLKLDDAITRKLSIKEYLCLLINKERREEWIEFKRSRRLFFEYLKREFSLTREETCKLIHDNTYEFAPFYDNGSSLGREIPEERLQDMLTDNSRSFEKYFTNGWPDIRVAEGKTTFNDTIIFLLEHYPEECSHFISNHLNRYNKERFTTIVNNIDCLLPPSGFEYYRLSEHRKQLIVKIIDARITHIYNNIPI